LSELFRVSYVSPYAGPRSSTQYVGELVFTDKAVCFVLHRKYRYANIWSFPVQLLYVILITMGAGLLTPGFGLVGGILGGATGALLARLTHVFLRRRSEREFRDGIGDLIQRKEKKGLEDVLAFAWRSGITGIEFTGDRLVLRWKGSSRENDWVEFRLLGTPDADLQRQIRSYVAEIHGA
jgi:hypothetical protein